MIKIWGKGDVYSEHLSGIPFSFFLFISNSVSSIISAIVGSDTSPVNVFRNKRTLKRHHGYMLVCVIIYKQKG